MIWHPLSILQAITARRSAALDLARRWSRAFRDQPELAADIIRLGGVLTRHPQRFEGGIEQPDPIDPLRTAFEAGRRDLALSLLAAGNLTPADFRILMETNDD